jgi:site-specific recombinase XerD
MGVFRDAMDQAMALRGLAPKTRSVYLSWVRRLVQFCRVVPDQLTTDQVRAYLLYLTQERKLSFSTFNQALNAVRFFFIEVLKRPFVLEGLRYQRPERRLPVVMSEEEVKRLLEGARSLRDRALLETAYATGMRVSEVTRLLLTDIDSQRMQIRVDQGKGRKDRCVMLSRSLLATLREYWRASKPKVFLFPGVGGKPLCVSAAQKAFDKARLQAGIRKPVSFHTLRHYPERRIIPTWPA